MDELKSHLMATDDEFRRLADEHCALKQRVTELEAKDLLTPEEEMEEHRMKKQKLRLKDQMAEIMGRYREQHV